MKQKSNIRTVVSVLPSMMPQPRSDEGAPCHPVTTVAVSTEPPSGPERTEAMLQDHNANGSNTAAR